MANHPNPSPKDLVWAVAMGQTRVSFDPDAQHMGADRRYQAPYHTVHIPYEPTTTPRIHIDENGVRYPISEDLEGRLAESWTSSDDNQVWDVTLRKGVKSHAGNELTAEDFKWCWDRVFALKGVGLWRSRRMGGLDTSDNVEIVDKYTIRFKLSGPNPEWPQYLLFATNNIVDAAEAKKHADPNDPWATVWLRDNACGYGAFAVDERWDGGISFKARDDYYAGKPGLNSITQLGATQREDGFRMLESGEANAVLSLYTDEFKRYDGRPGYQLMRVKGNHSTLEFNYLEGHFADKNVRQAVCYALPYNDIIKKVYGGFARQSKSPLGNITKFYTDEFWHYDTNVEKARELLKASAYPDGFETELYVHPTVESFRFGEIVRATLKPLGIDVELRGIGTRLPNGTKVPMWFKEECGHAVYEPMYDIGHDFDQPLGMMGGRAIRDKMWTDRLRDLRKQPSKAQEGLYRDLQRDIVDFATCAHIAEIETGWVFRGDIDPWAIDGSCIAINTTVWSQHRQTLGWW